MTEAIEDEFVEYLLERAGGLVRTVARYTDDGSEILYLGDDAAEEYSAQRFESVIEASREENDRTNRMEHLHAEDGRLNCVVRSFERGVEMHFVTGDGEGVLVGLDPDAATNLHGFVDECIEHLEVDR